MFTRKFLSKRVMLLAIVIALFAGAAIALRRLASANVTDKPPASPTARSAVLAARQAKGQGEFIQTIRVFIHPEDIYPGVVVVKPGKVYLEAENETQSDVSLIVERMNPGQARQGVAAVRTTNQAKRNHQEVTLGAGEYVYYEESRPQQQGKIIVDPHDR